MTTIAPLHIRRDDRGAVWIAETNVKVITEGLRLRSVGPANSWRTY